MNIDLHVHTMERSACACASEDEQIRAAIAAGLHAMFITDHWRLVPSARLGELNRCYHPFRVFGGIEVSIGGEDLLVLGIQDPILESRDWKYAELREFVRRRSGFLVLAHPFRYSKTISRAIADHPPDGIELYSQNTPAWAETEIRSLATQLHLALLSDSDAHIMKHLGQHYNILSNGARDEQMVFSQLRAGAYELYRK